MDEREIAKRFGKPRLLEVAEELEMSVDESLPVISIVKAIIHDMETNGIIDGEVSNDLFDVMVAMGFVDEDGNILDDEEGAEQETELEKLEEDEADLPKDLPKCFGWGDPDTDPSCKRCDMSATCFEKVLRNKAQLPCWGTYEADHDDCKMCVLWRMCQAQSS